jgi:hypothetical protein
MITEDYFMWPIIMLTLFLASAHAEIYEKPKYVPDENHLPTPEVQAQEERREKQMQQEKEKKAEQPELYKEVPKKVTPKDP